MKIMIEQKSQCSNILKYKVSRTGNWRNMKSFLYNTTHGMELQRDKKSGIKYRV